MSNLKDVKRQPVMLKLSDGVERELKYTLNSFAMMEEKYGSVEAAMKAMEKGSIAAIRFMIYAGLIHADETLTEMKVGSMIDIQELNALTEKMNSVMTADMPEEAEGGNPKE